MDRLPEVARGALAMPELPEVETVVRGLATRLAGEIVTEVQVRWPRIIATSSASAFERGLCGRQIAGVARRGKFIVMTLKPAGYLLVHLRMTGQLLWVEPGDPDNLETLSQDAHSHVFVRFASGAALCYHDQRKFGRLYLVNDPQEVTGNLGYEPLVESFTPDVLREALRHHRRRIKPLLLEQRILAGLGNIYVNEALWEAGIHPLRQAHTLTDAEVQRLYTAIRDVLRRAIENKGTTLRDYCDPQGQPGENQEYLAVHDRQGAPCYRCGQVIERMVVGGRGSYYCPRCQPLTET